MDPYMPDVNSYQIPISNLLGGYASNVHFSNGIGHEALLGFYFLFLFVYIIVSFALFYHWIAYGMANKYIILAEVSFSSVSIFLFWVAYLILTTL
jgi:hypothetical protein